MLPVKTILLVLALFFLIASTFNVSSNRVNLLAAGLALWVLSILVPV